MSDVQQARRVIRSFADLDGFTSNECQGLARRYRWTPEQCQALVGALGRGLDGLITHEEQNQLHLSGFRARFIRLLAGMNGREALRQRTRWLGARARHSSRPLSERHRAIQELRMIFASHRPQFREIVPHFNTEVLDPLTQIVRQEHDAQLRSGALRIIARSGDPSSLSLFSQALSDPDAEVRHQAINGLHNSDDPRAIPPLIRALEDADPQLRASAAIALREKGAMARPAISRLIYVAKEDPEIFVRARATEALGAIGHRTAEVDRVILQALQANHPRLRRAGITAIRYFRPVRNTDVVLLVNAMRDPHPDVRETAIWALARMRARSSAVRDRMNEALQDPDPNVRRAAQRALTRIRRQITNP